MSKKRKDKSVFSSFSTSGHRGRKQKRQDRLFGGSLQMFNSKSKQRAGRAGRGIIGVLLEVLSPTQHLHVDDPDREREEELQFHDPKENKLISVFRGLFPRRK